MLMKTIRDKGQQYIQYVNNPESNIKNKEQEQMKLIEYQVVLNQIYKQYKIMKNEIEIKNQSIQTENNIKVDQQTINNKQKMKDQSNQTGTNLKIDSLIIVQTKKILKQINLSIAEIEKHRFYYYNSTLFTKSLKFSTSLKHLSIRISADGKTAKSIEGWYLCLCDQLIPKYGTVIIDFKVKQLEYIIAGVYLIDSINKDFANSHGIGKGSYLLRSTGVIYSHHEKEKVSKQLGFLFQLNDIISMEVNVQQKQITWRNKAKNQVYTLDIQTTSDLYFCFHFSRQNEIELL